MEKEKSGVREVAATGRTKEKKTLHDGSLLSCGHPPRPHKTGKPKESVQ